MFPTRQLPAGAERLRVAPPSERSSEQGISELFGEMLLAWAQKRGHGSLGGRSHSIAENAHLAVTLEDLVREADVESEVTVRRSTLVSYRRLRGFLLMPDKAYLAGRRYRWDFRGTLAACIEEAGLDPGRITPHVLRHTFASIAAQAGVSLYKIGSWMGHSMAEVTELYAHLSAYDDDINRLNHMRTVAPQNAVVGG